MRGKLCRRAKALEIVSLRIERRELYRAACRVYSRFPFSHERVNGTEIEPAEGVAGVGIHSLVAATAGGFQVLQQVTVDKPFGRQRKRVRRIPVEGGVGCA